MGLHTYKNPYIFAAADDVAVGVGVPAAGFSYRGGWWAVVGGSRHCTVLRVAHDGKMVRLTT